MHGQNNLEIEKLLSIMDLDFDSYFESYRCSCCHLTNYRWFFLIKMAGGTAPGNLVCEYNWNVIKSEHVWNKHPLKELTQIKCKQN